MQGVGLRPAVAGDLPFLIEVYASTREDVLALVDWGAEQQRAFIEHQFRAQDVTYRARYPAGDFLVVTLDERPIGRLYVGRLPDEYRLVDITLLPEHRGRGIGSGLIRDLMDEAAAAGCRMTLYVEAFNPAHRLYTRLGFRRVDSHGLYELLEWRPDSEPVS
jgi:GNAT superfamily N-acetyltransferase